MFKIKKRFIVNEKNEPVQVILDLPTFKKIEELLEDHVFAKILHAASKEKVLTLEEAKRQYERIKKPR